MPGIYGGHGCPEDIAKNIRSDFSRVWAGTEHQKLGAGFLGGHAFGGAAAIHTTAQACFAVDGEDRIYTAAALQASGKGQPLYVIEDGHLRLTPLCKGNVAVMDQEGEWYIGGEELGTFPLYYAHSDSWFAFSSRLRPLAHAINAKPDPIGIASFLTQGYTYNGRTLFQGIRRLLPGQVIKYVPHEGRIEFQDGSRVWYEAEREEALTSEHLDVIWSRLLDQLGGEPLSHRQALMMSGGWDSRTLLAAMRHLGETGTLLCYSHGNLDSGELKLVRQIVERQGLRWRFEPINDAVFDLSLLRLGFERTESILHPHWLRSGQVLADAGVETITAGVYGEIPGGHFGAITAARTRSEKAAAFLRRIAGSSSKSVYPASVERVFSLVRPPSVGKHGEFLVGNLGGDQDAISEAIDADIRSDLERLAGHGGYTDDSLIEAFQATHLGAQLWATQLLSARAWANVAIPFADHALLRTVVSVASGMRLQNRLNLAILRQHASDLLKFRTAATLVPAGAPVLLQELSRLVRYAVTEAEWRLHRVSNGWMRRPMFGWIDYDFLRSGTALNLMLAHLSGELWDRQQLTQRVESAVSLTDFRPAYWLSTTLLKALAVQWMLE